MLRNGIADEIPTELISNVQNFMIENKEDKKIDLSESIIQSIEESVVEKKIK
jgi:hypothetical protein